MVFFPFINHLMNHLATFAGAEQVAPSASAFPLVDSCAGSAGFLKLFPGAIRRARIGQKGLKKWIKWILWGIMLVI